MIELKIVAIILAALHTLAISSGPVEFDCAYQTRGEIRQWNAQKQKWCASQAVDTNIAWRRPSLAVVRDGDHISIVDVDNKQKNDE